MMGGEAPKPPAVADAGRICGCRHRKLQMVQAWGRMPFRKIPMKKKLTTSYLIANGFSEAGVWSATEQRLGVPPELPQKRGVYAFAVDERVLYVGLASRSLRQRLNFYARPGASQRTNVRLNGLIRSLIGEGSIVRILVAHPQDTQWNGFRLSGPEGLEAALIEDFDIPWNLKGSTPTMGLSEVNRASAVAGRRPPGSVPYAILDFVAKNPRCTELQIAKGVFGANAAQPQANPYCRKLVELGRIRRLPTRPVTYLVNDQDN